MSGQAARYILTGVVEVKPREYQQIQGLFRKLTGIDLGEGRESLLVTRLQEHMRGLNLDSYTEYLAWIQQSTTAANRDLQVFVDLLTTHESYFFRDVKQIEFIRNKVLPGYRDKANISTWCAGCASGEEVYSLAMVHAEVLSVGANWRIQGSDVSVMQLHNARRATYPLGRRVDNVPMEYNKKYFLEGYGTYENFVSVVPELTTHTDFFEHNLATDGSPSQTFNLIFLRNVLIYFSQTEQIRITEQVARSLKPGGFFIVASTEPLVKIPAGLKSVAPSIYQKQERS